MVLNSVQNTDIPFVWLPVLHFTFIRCSFVSTEEQEEEKKCSYFSDLILQFSNSSAFCFYHVFAEVLVFRAHFMALQLGKYSLMVLPDNLEKKNVNFLYKLE